MYRNIIPLYQNNNIYINILIFENRSQNEKSARTSPKYYITLLYISPFWGHAFCISCLFYISWGILYIRPIFPRFSPRATRHCISRRLYAHIKQGTPFTPIYKYKLVQAFEKPIQARYSLLYKSIPDLFKPSAYIRSFFRLCVRLFFWYILEYIARLTA